jgi:signal transduction histidine kinase/DNA-binding response OmpR family regulator/HPt (histidine-containing phosphotransfer) domain-containing protein
MHGSLVKAHNALEQRVAERTAALEEANAKLEVVANERSLLAEQCKEATELAEESSRSKSAFLASMSHEIRTPMNGILGMAELLETTPLAPIQREYLGMVRESAESLLQIINDILDFSKMEAGHLELESKPFELRKLVGSTVSAFADRAHRKELELAFRVAPQIPDDVVGDPLRLRQVLVNLIGNAVKFTETGEVVVDVETIATCDGELLLHFEVRDTGIGIPKDRIEAIFEPFEQADTSSTRRYGGAGLGLTIASRLVRKLGGELTVESTDGEGSTFKFAARLRVAETSKRTPVLPADALVGLHVMVVDDNATNRRILEELLTHWRMDVTCVVDPTTVKDLLIDANERGRPYRLLLLDAEMPVMDGFSLAEQVLAEPKIDSTIIMMLSSMDRPGDAKRCKELGIALHLLKPVRHSELMNAIKTVIGIKPAPKAEQTRAMSPMRILVAEDSRVSQRLTMALLKQWGHTATLVSDGRQALEAIRATNSTDAFDLVLMDVQMPMMDGLSATRAIREMEREVGGHVPIIAMTAHAMRGDREQCLEAGMDGYLSKPIHSNDLRGALEQYGPILPKKEEAEEATLDWEAALGRLEGRESVLRSMAEVFVEDYPSWLAAIENAVSKHNPEALMKAAHTLKGAAQSIAAGPVAALALALETAGREGAAEVSMADVRELSQEGDALLHELAQRLVVRTSGGEHLSRTE